MNKKNSEKAMKMAGKGKKSGQKLSADKTNTARTRQYNKKEAMNLVCDEQLDDEVPKTMKALNTGWYGSEEGCERQCFAVENTRKRV